MIRTRPQPECLLCGNKGVEKYSGMGDRLSGTAGKWTLVECSNRDCGLLWLDPMPIPEDIHEAYEDYYTHSDAPADSWLRRAYRAVRSAYWAAHFGYRDRLHPAGHRLLAALVPLIPHLSAHFDAGAMWLSAKKDGRLLEICCGRGDILENLRELGWSVEGVDFDLKAVNMARARGLPVNHAASEDIHYADESFDAIIMSHVIEHLHDPVRVIAECHRMLKPGGQLVLLTPNTDSLGHKIYGRWWLHLDPPRHLYLFNGDTLSNLVREAGFDRLKSFTVLRDANWTLGASHEIKRHGAYRMGRLPVAVRIEGYCLMYLECLILLFNRKLGEEIVSVAQK